MYLKAETAAERPRRRRGCAAGSERKEAESVFPNGSRIFVMWREPLRSVRILPETLAYLHVADRLEHIAFMLPLLREGCDIVCDRYYPSNMAYNRTPRLSMEQIYELNRPCFETLDADLIIYLDVPPEETARRRAADRTAEELFDADEAQRSVYRNYRETLDFLSARGRRVAVIDASRPEAEVAEDIWLAVAGLFE